MHDAPLLISFPRPRDQFSGIYTQSVKLLRCYDIATNVVSNWVCATRGRVVAAACRNKHKLGATNFAALGGAKKKLG